VDLGHLMEDHFADSMDQNAHFQKILDQFGKIFHYAVKENIVEP